MRAIKIDPDKKTIEEVHYNGTLEHLNYLIGSQYFTVGADLPNGDTVYVDDEGLYNPKDFFQISHGYSVLSGIGIVLNTDSEGQTRPAKSSINDLRSDVVFIPLSSLSAL